MSTSTSHKTTISPVFASKICTSLHHTLNYLSRVALCYMIQSTCVLPFQLQGSNNFNEDGIKRSLTLLFLYGYDTVGFACARPQIIISISHSDHLISLNLQGMQMSHHSTDVRETCSPLENKDD